MNSDLNPSDLPADLPSLPNGWYWTVLSRLVDPNRGICYGIVQPGKHHLDGIPMVNTGDILDGRVNLNIGFRVEKKLHEQFRRSTLRGGEVLVTLVGANFGRVAIAPPEFTGHNCSRAVGVVPLKENSEFVMFALRSPIARYFFDTWANTTAQPTFNLKDLGKLPVPVPPVKVAKQISNFLMSLDNRITLLRETNATLEAIAQAQFKSWFVDFDPVHAKAKGLDPEGMDAVTAALFPDNFIESGLGLVPSGWLVGELQDLLVLQRGFDLPASDRIAGGYPLIAASGPSGTHHIAMAKGPGVVTGRSGVLGKVFLTLEDYWPLNTTLWVKKFNRATPCYAYELLKLLDFSSFNAGSAVPTLNRNHIHSLKYVLPPLELVQAYEDVARSIHLRVLENNRQVQTLIKLRDTLLPRLISGQLRLPETAASVENILSEAV